MITSKRAIAAVVLAVALSIPLAGGQDFLGGEVLANTDVIALVRAGLAKDLVLAKIATTPNSFDLSSRGIITLKANSVPDDVISSMMAAAERPAARPGVDPARFAAELTNIASGRQDDAASAVAWMTANQTAALPALRNALADPTPERRAGAIPALAQIQDTDSVPAIRNLLADSSPMVRAAAAKALFDMRDSVAIDAAAQAVSRQVNPVDGYARLVGYARLTQSAEALARILGSDPDSWSRIAAAWALGEIGRPAVVARPAIERALESDSDPAVRREAARAVAQFRDSRAADMLEDACRRDPEVRKVTLAAMADYPETMEFLVSVMNLGPDQIAADELETAKSSLERLSGQSFGLDASGWSSWFMANRGRFAPSTSGSSVAAISSLSPSQPVPAGGAKGGEIDIEAWSIIANPNAIPMAPQVEAMASATMPGSAAVPAGLAPWDAPGAGDTAAAVSPSAFGGVSNEPFGVPNMDMDFGLAESGNFGSPPDSPPSTFRTWSSDSTRLGEAAPASAAVPGIGGSGGWRELDAPPGLSRSNQPDMPQFSTVSSSPSASLPDAYAQTPSISTTSTAPTIFQGDTGAVSGLSLPLPIDGGSPFTEETMSAPYAAGPALPAATPTASPAESSFTGMTTLSPSPAAPAAPASEPMWEEREVVPFGIGEGLPDDPYSGFQAAIENPYPTATVTSDPYADPSAAADAGPFQTLSSPASGLAESSAIIPEGLFEPYIESSQITSGDGWSDSFVSPDSADRPSSGTMISVPAEVLEPEANRTGLGQEFAAPGDPYGSAAQADSFDSAFFDGTPWSEDAEGSAGDPASGSQSMPDSSADLDALFAAPQEMPEGDAIVGGSPDSIPATPAVQSDLPAPAPAPATEAAGGELPRDLILNAEPGLPEIYEDAIIIPLSDGGGEAGSVTIQFPPLPEPETTGSWLIVDPEPGQHVIGESLFGPTGQPVVGGGAIPAPAPVPPSPPPAVPASTSSGTSEPFEFTMSDEPTLSAGTPAQQAIQPTAPAPTQAPTETLRIDPPQPAQPPARSASTGRGSRGSRWSSRSAGDAVVTDPSTPLPPATQEGTVTGRRQGEMPPMLGEGFF